MLLLILFDLFSHKPLFVMTELKEFVEDEVSQITNDHRWSLANLLQIVWLSILTAAFIIFILYVKCSVFRKDRKIVETYTT